MHFTLLKQWKTLDGSYYSATVDKANYDLAVGTFHSSFLPMQNDTNVASFRFTLIDEFGSIVEKTSWTRPSEVEEVAE